MTTQAVAASAPVLAAPVFSPGIIQLKVISIDSTLISLAHCGGFRNLIVEECRKIGLRGYVWRVSISHANILAAGSQEQIDRLVKYLQMLNDSNFFHTFEVEAPSRPILINSFVTKPSDRRKCATGLYSDGRLDDIASQSSADSPVMSSYSGMKDD